MEQAGILCMPPASFCLPLSGVFNRACVRLPVCLSFFYAYFLFFRSSVENVGEKMKTPRWKSVVMVELFAFLYTSSGTAVFPVLQSVSFNVFFFFFFFQSFMLSKPLE